MLALAARRAALLDEVADEIADTGAARPALMSTDLSERGAAKQLASDAMDALGRIDVLINNAGTNLTGAQGVIADSDRARAVFELNVWSPLALTAALLPHMRAAGSGTIVNVTSTVQSVPLPLLGYYAASKAALAQATRSLRFELADTPIRIMEVIPGSTETALRDIDELPWKSGPDHAASGIGAGDGGCDGAGPPTRRQQTGLSHLRAGAAGTARGRAAGRDPGQQTDRHQHRARRDQRSPLEPGPVSRPTRKLTDDQIRIGATAGTAHVAIALVAHFAVPVSLAPRLGLVADPWFRRETGAGAARPDISSGHRVQRSADGHCPRGRHAARSTSRRVERDRDR